MTSGANSELPRAASATLPSQLTRLALFVHEASMDAPLVAALWFEILSGALGQSPLSPAQRVLLPLGVWISYAGDRMLDVRRDRRSGLATARAAGRHRFLARHFRAFVALWCAACVLAAVLGILLLSTSQIVASSLTCAGIGLYLTACQARPRLRRVIPREVVVGIVFALGTAIFLAPFVDGAIEPGRSGAATGGSALVAWLLATTSFAALCTWNCTLVSCFERSDDAACEQVSIASGGRMRAPALTRWSCLLACFACISAGALLCSLGAWTIGDAHGPLLFALAVIFASTALACLQHRSRHVSEPAALAPLCDFALCVPAPLLFF